MKSKKVRRVSEVNTKRINKRKYYGVGVEKREFKETLDHHVNHTGVTRALENSAVSVSEAINDDSVREGLVDNVVRSADMLRSGVDETVNDLAPKIRDSFEKGTRRAFNNVGETLPRPDDMEERVGELVDEQRNYVTKLVSDMKEKAQKVLREGLDQGRSESEIKQELDSELKNLKDNRSETVAESETVKAAGKGTLATFKANGVSKVRWISSQDDRVCEPGTFRVTYNGRTYTSCQELHGETFELPGNHPVPVESTHPGDRCVLVADE